MRVRLVSRDAATGIHMVSSLVEYEELGALAGRIQANVLGAIRDGVLTIVPGEGSLGRLFPEGEAGLIVAVFLSQEEMRAARDGEGDRLAELLWGGKTPKPRRRVVKRRRR